MVKSGVPAPSVVGEVVVPMRTHHGTRGKGWWPPTDLDRRLGLKPVLLWGVGVPRRIGHGEPVPLPHPLRLVLRRLSGGLSGRRAEAPLLLRPAPRGLAPPRGARPPARRLLRAPRCAPRARRKRRRLLGGLAV